MKLLTKEIRKQLPPIGSQDGKDKDAIAYVKFFTPMSNWTWYVLEGEPVIDKGKETDYLFFGLVYGFEREYGYFSLNELESVNRLGLGVERDRWFKPTRVGDCENPCE